jgi:hypothetical protein
MSDLWLSSGVSISTAETANYTKKSESIKQKNQTSVIRPWILDFRHKTEKETSPSPEE